MTLSPMLVWAAIITDPKFYTQAPIGSPLRETIKPFIEGSVEALADMHETIVTLETLMLAKIKFVRYCLDNDFGQAMDNISGLGVDTLNTMLENVIDAADPIIKNVEEFLKQNGVTEEDLMHGPMLGLNDENYRGWLEGTLTIAKLLSTQPTVILQNT